MKNVTNPSSREEVLEEQLEFQKKLNHITNRIHSAKDINDILINLQGEILGLFDADRITIYAVDREGKEIVSRFKTGTDIGEIRLPVDNESLAGCSAASGKLLSVRDVYDEGELKRNHPDLRFARLWDQKTGYKTRQTLVAPITCKGSTLGVIQLINKKSGAAFTSADRSSVREIADVLGIAFFNSQKAAGRREPTRFDYLVSQGILGGADLAEAISLARSGRESVESILMRDFHVTKEDIGRSLSDFHRTRFVSFTSGMVIPGHLRKGLKPDYLRHHVFVPIGESGGKMIVAMQDPGHLQGKDAVKRILPSKRFEYAVSLKEDIYKMIDLLFDDKGAPVRSPSGEKAFRPIENAPPAAEEFGRISEDDGAVVRLVNRMIMDAYHRGASDIHIEPGQPRTNALIRFRVDGNCQAYQSIPETFKRGIVSRLKIMSDLDISERRLPQDGKIRFRRFGPLDIELRVATIPTAGQNEDVVMRILSAGKPIALEKMGMGERYYSALLELIHLPHGIFLVVGPTGSGKTTTLHAILSHINKPETKIWTAEDPVEITQVGLRQLQVKPKIGLNFATAMRAFLRADPDVIMVGEMRDHETAATGIEASLTGHLVLSTLHTNSASETIIRLLDMGMDAFNFSDALLGVLAQRLVRTLCSRCKEKYHPTREQFDSLARAYGPNFGDLGLKYDPGFHLYGARGCPECGNMGYRGRTALYELLVGSDGIKALIQRRAPVDELRALAAKEGMTTLMQDGIRKVCLGETDLIQVRKVCIR